MIGVVEDYVFYDDNGYEFIIRRNESFFIKVVKVINLSSNDEVESIRIDIDDMGDIDISNETLTAIEALPMHLNIDYTYEYVLEHKYLEGGEEKIKDIWLYEDEIRKINIIKKIDGISGDVIQYQLSKHRDTDDRQYKDSVYDPFTGCHYEYDSFDIDNELTQYEIDAILSEDVAEKLLSLKKKLNGEDE